MGTLPFFFISRTHFWLQLLLLLLLVKEEGTRSWRTAPANFDPIPCDATHASQRVVVAASNTSRIDPATSNRTMLFLSFDVSE